MQRTTPSMPGGSLLQASRHRALGVPGARRAGSATVEFRLRGARGARASAGTVRGVGASHELAVSRRSNAARADPGRLHREREHRPNDPGVPTGRARCAAGNRVAGGAGLRAHRHSRHEPGVVPGHVDHRARASHTRSGAQPHFSAICRCRLAWDFDAPRS